MDCNITDNHFDIGSKTTGVEFSQRIEGSSVSLCNSADYSRREKPSSTTRVIDKAMLGRDEIQVLVHDAEKLAKMPSSSTSSQNEMMRPVAVLDDSGIFLMSWEHKNRGFPIHAFKSPEAFWEYSESNPGWFESLKCIITDNYFDDESHTTGLEFALSIKGPPVFLCTNEDYRNRAIPPGIAKAIEKKMLDWHQIQGLVHSAR